MDVIDFLRLARVVMSVAAVAVVVGLSLRRRFVALDAETQQALIGLLIIGIAIAAVVLGCAGVVVFIACTAPAIGEYFIGVVIVAVVGDRVSKATFATARWWDARAERNAAVKSLTLRDGRLLR